MELTVDQREFQDLVASFLREQVSSEYLRKRITEKLDTDPALVTRLAELGLSEGFCGAEAPFSVQELALVAAECGAVLMPEPISERLLCEGVLPRLLPEGERDGYVKLLAGRKAALAPSECCSLKLDAKGKVATGEISWCFGGVDADVVLAVAAGASGPRVAVFDVHGAGITRTDLPSLDLTTALRGFSLKKAGCFLFSDESSKLLLDLVEIIKSAEVFGLCKRVVDMTCEYVKTREQFGVPVGGFQAVQHKIVDCYAATEALGSLVRFAAWSVEHSVEQRALTARAAIAQAAEVGPTVCEASMQCHGGIGFTWEYDLHLYLRRAKVIQIAFPNSEARAADLIQRAAARM